MKSDLFYVRHVLACIGSIATYTRAGREAFLADEMQQDAVVRKLQILAESTQRISPSVKETHTEVEWRLISGLRNVLVHDYLGLNLEEIWRIVEVDLPGLETALRALAVYLGSERPES